jgi:ribosome maturation factor RimP
VIEDDGISKTLEPERAAAVRSLVEPAIGSLGLELVLVQYLQDQGRWVLRLFVGRPSVAATALDGEEAAHAAAPASVTIQDCEAVSRLVSPLLDGADPIPHGYVLEVSSPGIERPLVKPSDFERFKGTEIRIRTTRPLEKRQNFRGVLVGMRQRDVVVAEPDGERSIPYGMIKRASLVHEF